MTGTGNRRRTLQPDFGPYAMHQPFGLMTPATILQALGGWKFTQVEHIWPSFGVG